jgi:hypothetical protein
LFKNFHDILNFSFFALHFDFAVKQRGVPAEVKHHSKRRKREEKIIP